MCPYAQNATPFTPFAGMCTFALVILLTSSALANVYGLEMPKVGRVLSVNVLSTPQTEQEQILWTTHLKDLRKEIKDCVKLTKNTTWSCFKQSSTRIFDDIMSANIIPIWHGIKLVRSLASNAHGETANATNNMQKSLENSIIYERQDLQHLTWFDRLSLSLAKALTTHVLQINLKQLTDAYIKALEKREGANKSSAADQLGTARHRRHRYNMMITMMFGVTALGAVLVPMGFQMLSVVSGKALLLAKMALLLASINGLKKVANSGVHYGLYHVPGEHYGGYYDRGDPAHHPRHVASFAVAEPITTELGLRK